MGHERRARRDVLDRLGLPMPDSGDDPALATARVSQQLLVAARALLTPVIVVGGLVADDVHPVFWLLVAVRIAWQAAGAYATFGPKWRRYPARLTPVVDLALTTGSLLTSGGGQSPLRVLLVGLPVVGGYLMGPGTVASVGAASLVTLLLASAPDLAAGVDGSGARVGVLALAIAFSTLAGVAFALGRRELTQKAAAVDDARRRLLNAGLSAEDRERRRVSQDLHGEALQILLSAAQDLGEEDPAALPRARAGIRSGVAVLRETVRDLHPTSLRHAGLQASVRAALEHRMRDVASVRVAPGADGAREALLLSVVRELGDALAQAEVDEAVVVEVRREAQAVVLELRAGATPEGVGRLDDALAAVTERVEADGGTLAVGAGDDGRVTLTIRLLLEGAAAEAEPVDDDELRRRSRLLFSGLWLALLAFAALVALAGGEPSPTFAVLLGLVAVYYVTVIAITVSPRWERGWSTPGALVSFAVFGVALWAEGSATIELAALALTVPFLLVLVFTPNSAAVGSAVLGVVLAAAVVPAAADAAPEVADAYVVLAALYVWSTVSALLIAAGRQRMRRRLAALAQARRRLLHHSLDVADEERRRLSMRLHDGALQELMIAGQDVDQATAGDRAALASARIALSSALYQLRDTVAELHPPALEHGGLRPALTAVLERACKRGELEASTEVDPAADGVRDELVVALVRELVTNVSKHARARHVTVRVARAGSWLELDVEDDGVGTTPDRLATAVAEGHIGLAAARERVEADGGSLRVESGPGAGTHVSVRLRAEPVQAPA